MWRNFFCTTFYYEAFDLSGGRFESLGKWRFRSLSHFGVPIAPSAPAPVADAAAAAGGAP